MRVRIYKPSRNAMQSGRAGSGSWVLEAELETPRRPEPLMGWISSGDTLNQICIRFPTQDEAVAFAQRKGWDVDTRGSSPHRVEPRNYADNFRPGLPR
jgi:hypothetical protein